MTRFWTIIGEAQTDGLSKFTRYHVYAQALADAQRMAMRFPDTCFYVVEAVAVAVAPKPTVETYNLREQPLRTTA